MGSHTRANGDGSLYQRHRPECERPTNAKGQSTCKCPWQGVLTTGWRDKNTPVRRKVTGSSRSSAAAKLRELRDKVERGQLPKGRVPTVEEWLTYWLENIVPKVGDDGEWNYGTQRTYRTYVDRYLIPLLGDHKLDRLGPEHIDAAWGVLLTMGCPDKEGAEPLSPTTVHNVHAVLSRSLKVAQQRSKIMRNPATLMDAPKKGTPEVDILAKTEAMQVVAAAREGRNAARWTVAFALGLRQGEALGWRWTDINLDDGTAVVRKALKRAKGQGLILGTVKGKKARDIALPAQLVTELRAHRKAQSQERLAAGEAWQDHDYVFCHPDGRPIDPKDDWTTWRDLLASAGLDHVKLHSARHTAATMLLAMGVPVEVVAEILGHTDLRITRSYQKRVDDLHIEAARKTNEFFWN